MYTAANKKRRDDADSFSQLARQCLEETNHDQAAATTLYKERIEAHPALKARLIEPYFEDACRMRIAAASAARRRAIIVSVSKPDEGHRRLALLAKSTTEALLDFPIWGGKLLKDATKDEITESARLYQAHGSDMIRKSRWLLSVAKPMNEGERAGDRFSNDQLADLFEKSGD